VVHLGFPWNVASYRQQAGRAGRREQDCLSILVLPNIILSFSFFKKIVV